MHRVPTEITGRMASISRHACCLFFFLFIFAGKVCCAGDGGDQGKGGKEEVRIEYIRRTILRLERFGNRANFEKQWETARWLEGELRVYGVDARIETYKFKEKEWPNVVATIRG